MKSPWQIANEITAKTGMAPSDAEVLRAVRAYKAQVEEELSGENERSIPSAGGNAWIPRHLELERPTAPQPTPQPSPSGKSYRFDPEWEKLPNGDFKLHKTNERYE